MCSLFFFFFSFFEAFGHFLVVVVRVTKRALTFNRMVLYQATVECVCGHLEFTSGANAPFFPMGKKRNLGITPLKPIAFFVPLRGQNKGFELFVLCENVCVCVCVCVCDSKVQLGQNTD